MTTTIIRFPLKAVAIGLATLMLLLPPCAGAADKPASAMSETSAIPVADFFKAAEFSGASLSPDGKNIAMLTADQNDHLTLSVLNLETMKPKLLARYADADVGQIAWVNNHRLVYSLGDRKLAVGEDYVASGLYAVDIHSGQQRQLVMRNEGIPNPRVLPFNHGLAGTINQKDTNDVYVLQFEKGTKAHPGSRNLIRLDTVTGQTKMQDRPGEVKKWVVDFNGLPRVATTYADNKYITWLRDDKTAKWNKLFESLSDDQNEIEPSFFGPDGSFYVIARQGKDTSSLYRYDLVSNKIDGEPVLSLDGYDYNAIPVFNQSGIKILGFRYDTDAPGTLWLDEHYKAIQKKVDELVPGKVNMISIRAESDSDTVLVHSYADNDPGSYSLFNHKTGSFIPLGQERPWIKPQQMAYQDFFKLKARDGLTLPTYLTLPKGQKKNLPMVVMVHGGPNVRGEQWGWNPGTQFLASRGYAVLQVEFRGSMGYGYKHEQLGWKQWGLSMQDDVTDVTKWAIEQGIADPKRICIAGASYGGYAALWGLIKEPELYRCGVSWVGVTDTRLLYSLTQSDMDDDATKFFLPKKVGDLKLDAGQLKATSVVENAAKLKQPLILAYGGSDVRVPKEHGEKLMSAMKGSNPDVDWIVYPEEGHGWSKLKNNVDFWNRVEKFLNRNTWKQDAAKGDAKAAGK